MTQGISANQQIDSTLRMLQQYPTVSNPTLAIALIEQWQNQLQETHFFAKLSELKQAILAGRTATIANLLDDIGQATRATVAHIDGQNAAIVEIKVNLLGKVLSQISYALRNSLVQHSETADYSARFLPQDAK